VRVERIGYAGLRTGDVVVRAPDGRVFAIEQVPDDPLEE
jgi:hypothetical protein